jgi:hypothetical protein
MSFGLMHCQRSSGQALDLFRGADVVPVTVSHENQLDLLGADCCRFQGTNKGLTLIGLTCVDSYHTFPLQDITLIKPERDG